MFPELSISQDRKSLSERFRALAHAAPEHPAIIDGTTGSVTSRSSLLARAEILRARLKSSGIAAGDRVGIQLPNSVDFVAAFLAAAELGCTTLPIDRDARKSEIGATLNHFGVRALIYISGASDEFPSISVREVPSPSAEEADVVLIKLTSGSTGMPRGILTTAGNLIADCRNICETMEIRATDRNLGAIPFSHSYGFSNLVTPLLLLGTTIVVSNDYLPHSILNLSNTFACTVLPGIPMMFEHLSQLPRDDGRFATMRSFISAGAPLSASVSRRFRERFGQPIHSFYGCSECGGIAYDREGGAVERARVGSAMKNVKLAIDPDSSRLLVESEAVAIGYLDGPGGNTRFSGNRFLTDDLARLDDALELELTGRVGDLINTAGKKVNPREVETVILQMKGVRQARVFGEAAGARGEVVAAVVVADPDVTREQVRTFCGARLSSHKVPRIVKFIESIPL
ncbi:MAG TPA: class I adenylate-forming enzyme family protein, partial [Thermoanaerobaculia bacterium]|nr:class I adenylate-forming enzyme family protein [Thermoanaerobaculia bacterium]